MFDNTDNMARIEREIEKRLEAACEKNGWYVAVAMMLPETTTLHIEKFGEKPIAGEDAQAALNSAVAFAKAEFGFFVNFVAKKEKDRDNKSVQNEKIY